MSRSPQADADQADADQADADQADGGQADADQADVGQADAGQVGRERGDPTADLAVWDALAAIHDRVSKVIESGLWNEYNLAPRQLTILRAVADAPGRRLTLPALKARLGLSIADVSRLCTVLENRGLLGRRRTAQSTVLNLTGTGSALTRRAVDTQHDCLRTHLLPHLGPEEITALATLLTRINQPQPHRNAPADHPPAPRRRPARPT